MTSEPITISTITISTWIDAPVDHVWQCWTQPVHITQWNFASPDWCCPSADADIRVGGPYRARMEARDGSFGFDFAGTFEEVEPQQALTLVIADGRKARTTFTAMKGGTQVSTTFDTETQNPVELQRQGWQAILDNFKRHSEAVKAGSA